MKNIYVVIQLSIVSILFLNSCSNVILPKTTNPKTTQQSKAKNNNRYAPENVTQVINDNIDEIHLCYENELFKKPYLKGKIIFRWNIIKNGDVDSITVKSSTLSDDYVITCIKSKIATWKFAKPRVEKVVITYPFVFDVSGH